MPHRLGIADEGALCLSEQGEVREYFEQFGWYDPRFGEIELTYIEQKNVDLIRGFEK